MPDMVKIGFTDQLVDDRASKLFTTGVPLPFEIKLRALTMRWEDVEKLVHQQLARKRVTSRREFFYISPHEAIETIYTCIETLNGIRSWPTHHHSYPGRNRPGDPPNEG
ncbi:GIY-YIG nuclease family protein [Nocardia elegans]|nr:GIY-YIG nuclease family protein [Nocardia elegans]